MVRVISSGVRYDCGSEPNKRVLIDEPVQTRVTSVSMSYITRVRIEKCRNVENLDIDLSGGHDPRLPVSVPESSPVFRHLILTGPNGSGKSGVLAAIASEIEESVLTSSPQLVLFNIGQKMLQWTSDPNLLPGQLAKGQLVVAYLPARRAIQPREVRGPAKLKRKKSTEFGPAYDASSSLQQLLVNKHTEMTYATVEGNTAKAERAALWLKNFEAHMRFITEDSGLVAEYDLDSFTYRFRRSDGYVFDLNTLADGHAALLAILAELLMRVDDVRSKRRNYHFEPAGVVIVDEVETHLHPSLQEQILPFLTALFPRLQFIVATHSPAVIASIPNAIVCDLKKRSQTPSEHFRGIRYGTLMTDHFGISSEIDLESTEMLLRLRALASQAVRTEDQQRMFDELANKLAERSRTLAVEVWMIREGLGQSLDKASGAER